MATKKRKKEDGERAEERLAKFAEKERVWHTVLVRKELHRPSGPHNNFFICISCIKFLHDMCRRFWRIWVIFRTGSTQMAGSIPAIAFLGAWHPDLNLYLSLFGRTGGCNGCRFCFVKIRHIAYEKALKK